MKRVKLPPASTQNNPNSKCSFDEHDSAATLVGIQEQGEKGRLSDADVKSALGLSKGDEALARQEWEHPISSASVPKRQGRDIDLLDPLSQFRDLFTGTRCCSKCKKPVHSPRGHVRRPIFPHVSQTRESHDTRSGDL